MVPHFTLLTSNKLMQQTIVMEKRLDSDSLLGSILEKNKGWEKRCFDFTNDHIQNQSQKQPKKAKAI